MDVEFQLNVYEGDCGLVSLDCECIKSILYSKIARVPVNLSVLNSVKNCTLYSAPSLVHGKKVVNKFNEIVNYLKSLNYNIECGLSAKQASESHALENMTIMKLEPLIQYLKWFDTRNCEEFTMLWYMKALPLPFNYAHTKRLKQHAADLIQTHYPSENSNEAIKLYITQAATNCLSNLSVRLGNSDYFYGSAPSVLDIIVYSYIAPVLKLPLPCNEFTTLFTMWPNLVTLVKRIDAKYLPDAPIGCKYIKKVEKLKQNDDDVSYATLFILFASASTLMFCFALNKGIIKLSSA